MVELIHLRQSKFLENFPLPSGQISKNILYVVPVPSLFEEVYNKFWLDSIVLFPHILKISNVLNNSEWIYSHLSSTSSETTSHDLCCPIDQLCQLQNLIRIQCIEDQTIHNFLQNVQNIAHQVMTYSLFLCLIY